MSIHHQPQQWIEWLPLFQHLGSNHKQIDVNKRVGEILLGKEFFSEPKLLEATFSDKRRKERNSKIYLLWVDNTFNPARFIIRIDHNFERITRHSYTKWWNQWDIDGERDVYIRRHTVFEQNSYVIRASWWKRNPIMEIYNFWKKIWKKSTLSHDWFSSWFLQEVITLLSEEKLL